MEDVRTYVSDLKGIATYHEECLNVTEALVLDEVNPTIGNIDYEGTVFIKGNVAIGLFLEYQKRI